MHIHVDVEHEALLLPINHRLVHRSSHLLAVFTSPSVSVNVYVCVYIYVVCVQIPVHAALIKSVHKVRTVVSVPLSPWNAKC